MMEVWVDPATDRIKAIYYGCSTTSTFWTDQGYEKYGEVEEWMLPHEPPVIPLEMPPNPGYGIIVGADLQAEKPLHIQRTYMGVDFEFWCYVTQDIVDAYQGGLLNIGDVVSFVFIDHDTEKPLAQQKIMKTWT